MKISAIVLVASLILTVSHGAPANKSPIYSVGQDGSVKGGYTITGSSNSASSGKGGLALGTTYSESINFNAKPNGVKQVNQAGTVGVTAALNLPGSGSRNRAKRQLKYERNPDGSISGSFSHSRAINGPGHEGAFGVSHTFNFGPKGSSFSGGHSASLNGRGPGGQQFGFSQSGAQSQNQDQFGASSSGSNAASNHFGNPQFQSSNANANAFANNQRFHNPGGFRG